jgi:hypothetical protein
LHDLLHVLDAEHDDDIDIEVVVNRKRTWSHEEEEGFEDAIGLISRESVPHWDAHRRDGRDGNYYGEEDDTMSLFQSLGQALWNSDMKWWMFTVFAVFIWFVVLPNIYAQPISYSNNYTATIIDFDCPDPDDQLIYIHQIHGVDHSVKDLKRQSGSKIWEFIQGSTVDEWSRTYQQAREDLYDWKKQEFAPHLKNGSSIFESSCNIGRNLALTLDIVQEVSGLVSNIIVYGSDPALDSAVVAQVLFRETNLFNGQLGRICPRVDSTNLSKIPSDAFDLVYTSYISPIKDPLKFGGDHSPSSTTAQVMDQAVEQRYSVLCGNAAKYNNADNVSSSNNDDIEKDHIPQQRAHNDVEKMQRIQEDWYGGWVSEMVRIARPGAPVLVEEVTLPLCKDFDGHGGVSREFWEQAIDKYSWNIEMGSMRFVDSREARYHVVMRKKERP